MASAKEMKRLGDDADTVRRLAQSLLALADCDWSIWEIQFLEGLEDRRSPEPLSERQREKLVELRDSARSYRVVEGFAIGGLIDACWRDRFDLDDDDAIAFIERLKAERPVTLKHRPAYRLLAIARALDLAPRFADVG